MLLRTCLALFLATGAWAQQPQPAKPTEKGNTALTRSSFSAKDLHHEEDLTDLYLGNFADVTVDRGSFAFSQLFEMYLESYSRYCSASLHNKVEMTTQVCAEEPAPPNPFGQPPPPSHPCTTWRTVSLGYADPALYAAKRQLDADQAANQLKDIVGSMKNLMRPAVEVADITADMDALVRINACASPGLRRFQDNLVLFSMGKQPLLLPGASPATSTTQPPGVLADSDYNRLIEDLIADQARTWVLNRYVSGSATLGIVAHDPRGRPSQIRAKYFFASPAKSGRTQGSVIVSFTDGMPACIYFSDAPSTCQTPNRRIVAKYSSGGYVSANASPADSSPVAASVRPSELGGPRHSPASWDAHWMGQNMVIAGTVSRVDIDTKGSPQWVTIYLQESPDATFVFCSPYADLLQEKTGRDLSALVGKTFEVSGQVESPYCGPKAAKGSIRVVESKQLQVRDAVVQGKTQTDSGAQANVCVPGDLAAEWRNPPPGGKMEALQRQLRQSLRERATLQGFDQTKWMTVNAAMYATWNPAGPFRGVVTATDGGRCTVGRHEFLSLNP